MKFVTTMLWCAGLSISAFSAAQAETPFKLAMLPTPTQTIATVISPAVGDFLENGATAETGPEILMAGDTSCKEVVRFVCRWEDGQKYCDRAVNWICD
jgi:hypothetical protein